MHLKNFIKLKNIKNEAIIKNTDSLKLLLAIILELKTMTK